MLERPKVLLIIRSNKKKTDKSIANHNGLSNAAKATTESLLDSIINIEQSFVFDNNDIWLECEKHKPNYVIIDGLWVVPEKFEELAPLYPHIKWVIRIHSEISFIAQEGIFTDWVYKYLKIKNVVLTFNSLKIFNIMKKITHPYSNKIEYLPNLYTLAKNNMKIKKNIDKSILKIGVFGAARVLKNQLAQAVAALDFAEELDKPLELFININTKDPNGLPIYLNIIHLIKNHYSGRHTVNLVEWTNHETFLEIMREIDIVMQVSFTETFNLVCCDSLNMNTPIIGVSEIPWMHSISHADPVGHQSMLKALRRAYRHSRWNVWLNSFNLRRYNKKSVKVWENLFSNKLVD